MFEIPETLFDAQRALASQAERSREALAAIFQAYDPKSCIAAAGGMLTIPDFQAYSVRLEAVCHLAVASASGTKRPTKQDASRWFTQVGQAVTLMEDAAEDVFVGRVHFEDRNYLILEGLFEANCHHLQHMLNVLEQSPDIEFYAILRKACRTLLLLSDRICSRAGLDAFICGSEHKVSTLPLDQLPTLKAWASALPSLTQRSRKWGETQALLRNFSLLPPTEMSVWG
nr:hypothetical protein [Sinorhizobium meliloti]